MYVSRGVSYYTPRGLQRGSDKAENILGPGYQLLFPGDSKLAKVGLWQFGGLTVPLIVATSQTLMYYTILDLFYGLIRESYSCPPDSAPCFDKLVHYWRV